LGVTAPANVRLDGGLMALADSGRFDPARLRADRRARVLAGLAEDDFDALLLGRPANVRYATGSRPLWLAGARAFAPAAVVLRDGETHLLGVSDDGLPPEIPVTNLYRTSWNPANLMRSLAAIDGLGSARRIGVDGLTPMFEQLLASTFPAARLDDATPLLRRARATKTADELSCMRTASAVCESALWVVVANLVEGVAEHELLALFVERMASHGMQTPAFDGTFCVTANAGPLRRLVTERTVGPGELVALDAGVLYNGYEGGLGRTWLPDESRPTSAQRAAARRARDALDALLDGCRPGVSFDQLAAIVPDSDGPVAYGVGLGVEPLATDVGSTLCLQVLLDGVLLRDTVVLRPDGPERLSRYGWGPLLDP
jgi:Xaa-Pro dipeptidase